MEFALLGIGGLFGIAAFVCFVLIVIKMFQNNQTGLGIGSIIGVFICGIGYLLALIFGWKNKNAWGLQTVMPIYTVCFILSMVLGGAGYAIILPKLATQIQQEMERQKGSMSNEFGTDGSNILSPQP
jgi:hypothetical protein